MGFTRRTFIRSAALLAAGNAAGLGPVGMLNAAAQTAGPNDYKALVCIFLSGGNDANNLLVPFDAAGYANYAALRGPLALTQNALLPSASLPGFALHPSLAGTLAAAHACAISGGWGDTLESVLASRPDAGVAERKRQRRTAQRLGRPHR